MVCYDLVPVAKDIRLYIPMPKRDPCKRFACEIQKCLKGICAIIVYRAAYSKTFQISFKKNYFFHQFTTIKSCPASLRSIKCFSVVLNFLSYKLFPVLGFKLGQTSSNQKLLQILLAKVFNGYEALVPNFF